MKASTILTFTAALILTSLASPAMADDATSGADRYEAGARARKDEKHNALMHVNPLKGHNVTYYFNAGAELDKCIARFTAPQPRKSLELKWHNYTFASGDLKGKTVRQADACEWVPEKK